MGSLSECLVQELGALAVEVYGALVVGQGLAVTGIGGSQEAGQPIHCHWAWDGEMKWGAAFCQACHQCSSSRDGSGSVPAGTYH